MLATAIALAFIATGVAIALTFGRLLIGPSVPDRVLALDTLYVNAVALLLLLGIDGTGTAYFEAALLISLIGFLSTVALARYALRGNVVE